MRSHAELFAALLRVLAKLEDHLPGNLALSRRPNYTRSELGNQDVFSMPCLRSAVTFLTRASAFFDVGPGPYAQISFLRLLQGQMCGRRSSVGPRRASFDRTARRRPPI